MREERELRRRRLGWLSVSGEWRLAGREVCGLRGGGEEGEKCVASPEVRREMKGLLILHGEETELNVVHRLVVYPGRVYGGQDACWIGNERSW